ncbi:MAG: sarcosine oxidase subunit gamma family protein [Hyphomicrobiaceae bacterium]|nr:sarcosine oxidase subunit gamma family protein [Hyphomicrobiaceae bacterium]
MVDPRAPACPVASLDLPGNAATGMVAAAYFRARLSMRAAPDAAGRLGEPLGLRLDGRTNTAEISASGGTCALRLGPDEWLLLSRTEPPDALAARIAATAGGTPHALVDVSHRHAGLELAGPAVEAVLASGCPLPLGIAAFPPGRATRTLLAKAEILLWRLAADRFHIDVARSLAPYTVGVLREAIGVEVAIAELRSGQ